MTWPRELIEVVQSRAAYRCEYCKMHQSLQGATFHVEHITPRSKGGSSDLGNLAWACPSCNLQKQDKTDAIAPDSEVACSLLHPRRESWEDHFEWHGYLIAAKSPTARATIALLDLNHAKRVRIRQAEELFGLFPPSMNV